MRYKYSNKEISWAEVIALLLMTILMMAVAPIVLAIIFVKNHWRKILPLFLILLVAFCLRYEIIQNVGLKLSDEAGYVISAGILSDDIEKGIALQSDLAQYSQPFSCMKPLHVVIISLGIQFWGIGSATPLLISVITGTLTILVVFFIGRELYGYKAGIFSAFILSVIQLHVLFSSSYGAWPEANTLFFFSATMLFYVMARKRKSCAWMITACFFAGLTMLMREIGVIAFALITFLELIRFRKHNWKEVGVNLFTIYIVFMIFLTSMLFIYAAVGLDFPAVLDNRLNLVQSYYSPFTNAVLQVLDYGLFSYLLVSPIIWLLAMFGIVYIKKGENGTILLVWLAFIIIFLLVIGHKEARDLLVILPPIALLGGYYLSRCKKVAQVVFVVALIVFSLLPCFELANQRYEDHLVTTYRLKYNMNAAKVISNLPTVTFLYGYPDLQVRSIENVTEERKACKSISSFYGLIGIENEEQCILLYLYEQGYTHIILDESRTSKRWLSNNNTLEEYVMENWIPKYVRRLDRDLNLPALETDSMEFKFINSFLSYTSQDLAMKVKDSMERRMQSYMLEVYVMGDNLDNR